MVKLPIRILSLCILIFLFVNIAVAADNNLIGNNKTQYVFNSTSLQWDYVDESGNIQAIPENNTTVISQNHQNFGKNDNSLFDKGSIMVADGFKLFLVRIADEMVSLGFRADEDELKVRDNYGYVVSMIYQMATAEFDPESNPFIREIQLRCNIIGIFLILSYIFLGASSVNLTNFKTPESTMIAAKMRSKFHINLSEYGATVMEMCLMQMFGYFFLWFSIQVEAVFTKLVMMNILDKIAPTGENTIMYLMMAICYLIMGIFMAYRIIVIALFHCGYLIIIGLYCFPISRESAKSALYYYMKILFMRTIIVAITVIGVGVTSSIDVGSLGLAAIGLLYIWPLMYSAMIVLLIAVSLIIILQIKDVFGVTKRLVRHYV